MESPNWDYVPRNIIPDQDDGPVQLLVRGIQEAGAARLGEPLARIPRAGTVRAVDQPGAAIWADGDQRGQGYPRVVAAGHRHYRGMAAAAPGAASRRPQALAGLVFPAEPGAQVRRRAFMTGQVSSRHLAIFSSSRSAARRAGTCTDQPIRCSSTAVPASVYSTPNSRQACSATWAGVSLHCAPPAPLEASAARPPEVRALRHRFTLIRDTRKCRAISRSPAPASIISAAASRTRSRRARSAASRPPPSGYLIPQT